MQKIEGGRMYFHILPNLYDDELDAFQYRLLGHYVRVAGDGGACWESTDTTAAKTRISKGMVSKTRQELADLGYITITRATPAEGGHLTIRIVDKWLDNIARYAQPVHTVNAPVHVVNTPVHTVNQRRTSKENPIEEDKTASAKAVAPRKPSNTKSSKKVDSIQSNSENTPPSSEAPPHQVINAIIDAWALGQKTMPAVLPYANKTVRAQALALSNRYTPDQVTAYVRQLANDPFWANKLVTFQYVANNIAAGLHRPTAPQTHSPSTVDSTSAPALNDVSAQLAAAFRAKRLTEGGK